MLANEIWRECSLQTSSAASIKTTVHRLSSYLHILSIIQTCNQRCWLFRIWNLFLL